MESLIDKIARTSAGVSRPGGRHRGRKAKLKIRAKRPEPPRPKRPVALPSGAHEAIGSAMRGKGPMTRDEVLAEIGVGLRFTYLQGWGQFNRMLRRGQIVGEPAPLPGKPKRKLYRLTSDLA